MSALLWRIIIAVLCVVAIFALLPLVLRVIGFDVSGDVITIIKICVGLIALLYILRGPTPTFPS